MSLNRIRSQSGVILASALWIIIILSLLAVAVSRNSGIDGSLVKYSRGKVRSYFAAASGIAYARQLIREDTADSISKDSDTLLNCGLKSPEGRTLPSIVSEVNVEDETHFSLKYQYFDEIKSEPIWQFGFEDEERKININAMTTSNFSLLSELIVELGFSRDDAIEIAASVADWHDEDEDVTVTPQGAESEYYQHASVAYKSKNRPFDHIKELLMIKGMRPEIFERLKNYVTIYPKEPMRLAINLNTAPRVVIKSFVSYAAKNITGLDSADSNSLVEKIIAFRNGPDGVPMTDDDQAVTLSGNLSRLYGFTLSEEHLFLSVAQAYHVAASNFFRVNSIGIDSQTHVSSRIQAVISRESMTIMDWHRE